MQNIKSIARDFKVLSKYYYYCCYGNNIRFVLIIVLTAILATYCCKEGGPLISPGYPASLALK